MQNHIERSSFQRYYAIISKAAGLPTVNLFAGRASDRMFVITSKPLPDRRRGHIKW